MTPTGGSARAAHRDDSTGPGGRARRTPRWRTLSAALACAGLLGGCALYHPLPLARGPNLIGALSGLRTQLPALRSGEAPRRIATDKPLGLRDIGLLAVLNDPSLREERGEMDLAQAGLLQASLLPNPSANFSYEAFLGGIGTSGWAASLSQDVRAILTYHPRVKSAHFLVRQVNADLLWREWQVAQQARLLGLELYWGGTSIDLSLREAKLIALEVRQARVAARSGALDLTALAPLLAAKAAADQTLAALRLVQMRNWQTLDALLGLEPSVRFPIGAPRLRPPPSKLASLLATLPDRRPDLVALRLGYRSADEDVRSAIIGQFPAFALGGIWEDDNGNVRNAGPVANFDLPLFDRNQGQVARTRATRLALHEQYQARLDQAVGAAKGLAAQIRRLRRELRTAQRAAASAAALSSAAQQAYAQGAIGERALTDYETTALQRELEAVALARSLGAADIVMTVELGEGLPQTRIASPESKRKT